MKIWPFVKRDTSAGAGVVAVKMLPPVCNHGPAPNGCVTHPTRFRPGQSGNPAGRRRGIGNDLMEARHIAAGMYRGLNLAGLADDVENGRRDGRPEMVALVAALKRGRVLGKRGKGAK